MFAPFTAGEMIPGDAVADDALPEVIAGNLAVYGHPTSTVPMGGPGNPSAVVDAVGAVQGLTGLRVVDASIIPEIPSTVTNLTTHHGRRAHLPTRLRQLIRKDVSRCFGSVADSICSTTSTVRRRPRFGACRAGWRRVNTGRQNETRMKG